MLDNLEPAGAAVVTSKVPAVPRFIMLRFLERLPQAAGRALGRYAGRGRALPTPHAL